MPHAAVAPLSRVSPPSRLPGAAELCVEPGKAAGLDERPTSWPAALDLDEAERDELRANGRSALKQAVAGLSDAEELLWASDTRALLVVFQAMDAAGKDSTIKHVFSGVNPQGVHVTSFKQPSAEELDHDFLWRVTRALPERGRIGVFNRSHYEEVAAVRVHPEWLDRQRLPAGEREEAFWRGRFEAINAWERHVVSSGTAVVKFFLHVSREEQRARFVARLGDPEKQWKFSAGDVDERARWDDYRRAYEQAITATSTSWAPWFVIPADQKWLMHASVARILVDSIADMELQWPK